MAFELFTDYGTASRQTISIRESGLVYISNALVREFLGQDPEDIKYYRFFVDRNEKSIALDVSSASEESEGWKAFTKTQKTKSGVLANAMPILRSFGYEDKNFAKSDLEIESLDYEGKQLLKFSVGELNKK